MADTSDQQARISQLLAELQNVKADSAQKIESLEKKQAESKAKAKAIIQRQNEEARNKIKALEEEKRLRDEELTQVKTKLKKVEEDNESLASKQSSATPTAQTGAPQGEDTKVLEAKIYEMDRVVESKQAEIVRLKERAKSYLRDITAEKNLMEEKNKAAVDVLKRQIEQEKRNVKSIEQKYENSNKEVENCLGVIREKQKNIQMLKMNVSSYKKKEEEAKQETKSIQIEFEKYKQRARLALQEKENSQKLTEEDIDKATSNIRSELEKSRKENYELRKKVDQLKSIELTIEEMKERTERAETVAELLRKDATGATITSTSNFSQVDQLEEKVSKLETELSNSKSQVEDLQARYSTTKMRMENSERSLHDAEVKTRNVEAKAKKTIEMLKDRIEQLEQSLKEAKQSAAAAQRTATAAARALAFSSSGDDHDVDSTGNKRKQGDNSALNDGQKVANGYSDVDFDVNGVKARPTLATALEDTSDKLGLPSPRRSHAINDAGTDISVSKDVDVVSSSAADAEAKEQQITVLTTQLAELGVLFDEAQRESELRGEQMEMLKAEVKNLDAKLASADKLKNGAPFSYLRTIVVRYLETEDITLLPVICNVLSFSDDETKRVKSARGKKASTASSSSYFSMPFLGSR